MRTTPLLLSALLGLVGCGDDKGASTDATEGTSTAATNTTKATSATGSSTEGTGTGTGTGSGSGSGTAGADGDPARYSESCAPDDGSAVEFLFDIAVRECTSDVPDDAPILRITLYRGVDLAVGDYPLAGGNGFAYYDTGDGMPVNGDVGSLTVTSVSADGLVGTYDVTLADMTHLTGSFDGLYCPQDVLCG